MHSILVGELREKHTHSATEGSKHLVCESLGRLPHRSPRARSSNIEAQQDMLTCTQLRDIVCNEEAADAQLRRKLLSELFATRVMWGAVEVKAAAWSAIAGLCTRRRQLNLQARA